MTEAKGFITLDPGIKGLYIFIDQFLAMDFWKVTKSLLIIDNFKEDYIK